MWCEELREHVSNDLARPNQSSWTSVSVASSPAVSAHESIAYECLSAKCALSKSTYLSVGNGPHWTMPSAQPFKRQIDYNTILNIYNTIQYWIRYWITISILNSRSLQHDIELEVITTRYWTRDRLQYDIQLEVISYIPLACFTVIYLQVCMFIWRLQDTYPRGTYVEYGPYDYDVHFTRMRSTNSPGTSVASGS